MISVGMYGDEAHLLDALPASVELPAGAGKTWLLTDAVREIHQRGGRALVLTHTNAGVHAVKAKLREFGIASSAYHVATITSFAFEIVRSYSRLADLTVPEIPDWDKSNDYLAAAARAVRNRHLADVLRVSFTHLLVDEYQDCSIAQHTLVLALRDAIPAAAVFGDPLQAIFGFGDRLVGWSDVLQEFPAYSVPHVPRRWAGHNEDLGSWLVEMRTRLEPGARIDFGADLPSGVTFLAATPTRKELRKAALWENRPSNESVVVIAPPDPNSARAIASQLDGVYSAMEDIAGVFMAKELFRLSRLTPSEYAIWLVNLAKQCFVGYGGLDKAVITRLTKGRTISALKRPGLERTLRIIDRVAESPTLAVLSGAMRDLRLCREAKLHSHEAWADIASAIEACSEGERNHDLVKELGRLRERVRHGGRKPHRRVVARTALIKGLEYDHAIIADLDRIKDRCNLYVALTRARKTVTIIGQAPQITITETLRAPRLPRPRKRGT